VILPVIPLVKKVTEASAHAASGALEGGKFRFQASIRNHRGSYLHGDASGRRLRLVTRF
jgi:hypothetical protein